MNQALYRKYRSKSLSEIVGQEHVTTTLDHALKKGRIAHAYLFTGPRGVGKTSIARILAHQINELPYTDESAHLDIIEIDAASNRRIDEIRDLRDKVHIAPTSAKYKVYIIDEVHMLTKEAFNALLKTLEEPPAHVIFILATTEAHKLPETIISRTQRFHFKPVDQIKVIEHLKDIAQKEGFEVDGEALEMIARYGEGSFRDSISLLDQLGSGQAKVTISEVRLATGYAPAQLLETILAAVDSKDVQSLLSAIENAEDEGITAKQLSLQLIQLMRQRIKDGNSKSHYVPLMKGLLKIESSVQPETALEVTLLSYGLQVSDSTPVKEHPTPAAKVSTPVIKKEIIPEKPKSTPVEPEKEKHVEAPKKPETKPAEPIIEKTSEVEVTTEVQVSPFDEQKWGALLSSVKSSNPSLYSVLRMAVPEQEDSVLQLRFKHAFHQKRLKESKNMEVIKALVTQLTGTQMPIESIHDPKAEPSTKIIVPNAKSSASIERSLDESTPSSADPSVNAIMSAFGGGEVIEV